VKPLNGNAQKTKSFRALSVKKFHWMSGRVQRFQDFGFPPGGVGGRSGSARSSIAWNMARAAPISRRGEGSAPGVC
jgi:hypothetical protein